MTLRISIALLFATVLAAFVSTGVSAQTTASDHTYATRYDSLGRVVGTISPDPDGAGGNAYLATRTTYDARGLAVEFESGELSVWKNEHVLPEDWGSAFNRHSRIVTTYDNFRRKLSRAAYGNAGPAISLTQYSYDNRGRLECTAVRMNPATWASLPSSACTLGTQGPDGPDRITRTYYDAAGQVLQIRKAVGTPDQISDVTYSYTANGLIENVVDANGNRAKYHYDGHDRMSSWHFANPVGPTNYNPNYGQVWGSGVSTPTWTDFEAYKYDANGNRTELRKRDGSVIKYTYDALNRVTKKDLPDTRPDLAWTHRRDVHYTYDLRGLQLSATFDSPTGVGVHYTYDGFGRLTSETQSADGGVMRTVSLRYDANGNRTRVTHPDGAYFTFDYDGLNRMTNFRQYEWLLGTMSYNSRGLPERHAITGSTSDANHRDFGYDNAGRLDSLEIDLWGSSHDITWDYARNPASQIKSESQSNDTYSWDGQPAQDITRAYTTNGLNQYTAAGSAAFCYDKSGNLTADGASVYLYDYENRLVQRRVQTNSDCNALSYSGVLKAELWYGPTGRLYRTTGGSLGTQNFIYDGNALIAEYNWSGTLLRRYVHGSNVAADDPLVWYEGAGITWQGRRYFHSDPRGSIVAVTSHHGTIFSTNTYDEFGIPDTASGNDIATKGRFRYTGQAWIPQLGMYYYKARIYSPTLGRFMQTDPIGYEDQFNLYAYVGNDPINGVDPTGLDTCHLNGCGRGEGRRRGNNDPMPSAINDAAGDLIEAGIEFVAGDAIKALENPTITNAVTAVVTTLFKPSKIVSKACCFVAGTLVDTRDGLRAIEIIQIGDMVWARDEATGDTALKPVIDLIRRHERVIWEVSLTGPDGERARFETTDDHPWWIGGQGWRTTEELMAGMAVVTRDGRGMVIASVAKTARKEATFNLTVADFETYFVGEHRVLVHNCNIPRNADGTFAPRGGSSRTASSEFTQSQRRTTLQNNRDANGGNLTCENCKRGDLVSGVANQRGVPTPANQAQIHHIPAISQGGGRTSKAEVLCPKCHKEKHSAGN